MKKLSTIIKILILTVILTLPALVFADTPLNRLENIGGQPGGYEQITDSSNNDIFAVAGLVTRGFLSILGIIFLILMLYGGYTYMNAGGDQAKVDKAINIIRRGIIGLLITFGAFVIAYFVFSKVNYG